MNHLTQFLISNGGSVLFLIVFAEQSGLPFPAAPWLLAAGALAVGGRVNLLTVILWATIASLAADSFWFYAGHRSKARLFQLFPQWHPIRAMVAQKTQPALILRGVQMLTAAKFLPLGILVPLRAGAFEVSPLRFLLVDAVCSLFYASLYVLLGFFFHDQLEQLMSVVRRFGAFAVILVLLLVAGYYSARILNRIRLRQENTRKLGNGSKAA